MNLGGYEGSGGDRDVCQFFQKMGANCGGCWGGVYERFPHLQKWENQFNSLKLTEREINILYKKFRKVDADKSG